MMNKETQLFYAELWRKFISIARFQGAGRFEEGKDHKHLGVYFEKGEPSEKLLENWLKPMVQYAKGIDDAVDRDCRAMCALLNFEEVRKVANNCYALTTTYNGAYGLRHADSAARRQHEAQEQLIQDILNFEV